jgi:hypothetical protein
VRENKTKQNWFREGMYSLSAVAVSDASDTTLIDSHFWFKPLPVHVKASTTTGNLTGLKCTPLQ